MADNYVYILEGKAYVNLTNKCHNACSFCIRRTGDGVAGTPLILKKEPSADDVMSAFSKLGYAGEEVVFCGYGEPTERLDALKECAKRFKALGYSTRLNTNGLGDLVNGRDISAELNDIDVVSVSLDQCDAKKYAEVTSSAYGPDAFDAVIRFALGCKAAGRRTVFTVVDTIGSEDIESCKRLCEKLDIPLRVRKYISNNYNG